MEGGKYACLNNQNTDSVISAFESDIRNFVATSGHLRSVDGFLIALGTLVVEVEEKAPMLKLDAEVILSKILGCTEVVEALRPLANYVIDVERMISEDPRHRRLRPYERLILKRLLEITPVHKELARTRPPIDVLERSEPKVRKRHEDEYEYAERRRKVESIPAEEGPLSSKSREESSYPRPDQSRQRRRDSEKRARERVSVEVLTVIILLAILLLSLALNMWRNKNLATKEAEREPTVFDIKNNVLEELNKIRVSHGIPPVKLSNFSIAQYRAEDMVRNSYFGHCDLHGVPTSYYYTSLGGVYFMEENVGYMGKCVGVVFPTEPAPISAREALEYARSVLRSMMYDDESSNWGHRDSLLDPTNNYVDIGVAWDRGVFILVIQMNKIWVSWVNSPAYADGVFRACGRLLLNNSKVVSVVIYKYETKSHEKSLSPLVSRIDSQGSELFCKNVRDTCKTHSVGNPIAAVAPSSLASYVGVETIVALRWIQYGDYFCIDFMWRPREKGIYTIVFFAENVLKISHPYDPARYNEAIPILEYTFVYP